LNRSVRHRQIRPSQYPETDMRLHDKTAIITGAGTGIGEAIAHKFSREGARLLLSGLPDDPVADVAKAIASAGGQVEIHFGDLSEEQNARACVDLAIQRFGALDVLVNNAGIFIANAETDLYRIEDFDRTLRNNIRTAFLMTKFALPHLRKSRGNIVFTGSEAGLNGSPRFTPYGGSKGFLHAFAKGVALEQAPYGVRANCVCPGPIDTAWTRGPDSPIEPAAQATIGNMVPLGRRGTPEEIANIFAFLASDEASYVTGALWLADGGVTPAKSDIGTAVPADLRQAPRGVLTLKHSHDGLRGKEVFRAGS
jgi:NAD(P)-dependent dehydrogenase (short-subunit alcohol dehydrogenase family)